MNRLAKIGLSITDLDAARGVIPAPTPWLTPLGAVTRRA